MLNKYSFSSVCEYNLIVKALDSNLPLCEVSLISIFLKGVLLPSSPSKNPYPSLSRI